MKKIVLGVKKSKIKYDFRETCFGIIYKDNKFYLTKKNNEISLIGGGVEKDETHEETLKREFIEEAGLTIKNIYEFITIDCYWITRNNDYMNSLANFYIVEIEDKINKPTESASKLIVLEESKIKDALKLPYQKEAIELFYNQYIK
jgi:8-oxo-dGTP diphosphatase